MTVLVCHSGCRVSQHLRYNLFRGAFHREMRGRGMAYIISHDILFWLAPLASTYKRGAYSSVGVSKSLGRAIDGKNANLVETGRRGSSPRSHSRSGIASFRASARSGKLRSPVNRRKLDSDSISARAIH